MKGNVNTLVISDKQGEITPIRLAKPPGHIMRRMKLYANEDPQFWQVPQSLRNMARECLSFANLNSAPTGHVTKGSTK